MEISNPDGGSARVIRRFEANRERLWQAFTDPTDMAQWMWGGYTENAIADTNLRIGGRYSIYTDSNATKDGWHTDRVGRFGLYVEIVPKEKLVYTLQWDAPVGYNQKGERVADEFFVVTLREDGAGTVVEVNHYGIPNDGVSAEGHGLGLGDEMETLATLVEPSDK